MQCDKLYKEYETLHIDRPFPAGNPEGGINFVVRGLTSKETAIVMLEANVDENRTFVTLKSSDHKAVFCGLGGLVKLGEEGWDFKDGEIIKPLSFEIVETMTDDTLRELASVVITLTYPSAEQIKN